MGHSQRGTWGAGGGEASWRESSGMGVLAQGG
jgi:hypothetical protein